MQKRGIEFVPATIITLFLLIVVAFILIGMFGRTITDTTTTVTCEAQGGTCQAGPACPGTIRMPFKCATDNQICCKKE